MCIRDSCKLATLFSANSRNERMPVRNPIVCLIVFVLSCLILAKAYAELNLCLLYTSFQVDEWADLSLVMPGDACPKCGAALQGARGIEVSQVFQLGDKYSKTMGAVYSDENGVDQNFLMGCYGCLLYTSRCV